jgi:hypothetical protein
MPDTIPKLSNTFGSVPAFPALLYFGCGLADTLMVTLFSDGLSNFNGLSAISLLLDLGLAIGIYCRKLIVMGTAVVAILVRLPMIGFDGDAVGLSFARAFVLMVAYGAIFLAVNETADPRLGVISAITMPWSPQRSFIDTVPLAARRTLAAILLSVGTLLAVSLFVLVIRPGYTNSANYWPFLALPLVIVYWCWILARRLWKQDWPDLRNV